MRERLRIPLFDFFFYAFVADTLIECRSRVERKKPTFVPTLYFFNIFGRVWNTELIMWVFREAKHRQLTSTIVELESRLARHGEGPSKLG